LISIVLPIGYLSLEFVQQPVALPERLVEFVQQFRRSVLPLLLRLVRVLHVEVVPVRLEFVGGDLPRPVAFPAVVPPRFQPVELALADGLGLGVSLDVLRQFVLPVPDSFVFCPW
jgi:hypothetical protein